MEKLNFWIEQNLDILFNKNSKSLIVKDAFSLEKEKKKFKKQLLDFSEMQMNKSKFRKRNKDIQDSKKAENKDFAFKINKINHKLRREFKSMAKPDLKSVVQQYAHQ
jgi:hypothetical protein